MSFFDDNDPGLEIIAKGGKLVYAGPVRKDFWYWLPFTVTSIIFIVAFITSGYFNFQQPFEDRAEYLVAPFTAVMAIWGGINGKQLLFLPAFFLGIIWSATAVLSESISFNVAAYVFSYCCTVTVLCITQLLRSR